MKNQTLTRKWTLFILVSVLLVFIAQNMSYGQGSAKIYWTESGKIRRANLDGSNIEDILTGLELPKDITLDLDNRKIYWVNFRPPKVYRANLDGSNIEEIIDGGDQNELPRELLNFPYAIALDTEANKIYWGRDHIPWIIRRADINGANIEDVLVRPWVDAESLELDVKAGKMYWADSFNDNIGRANLDGSDYEELGNTPAPLGLALDLRNRYVYWTDPFLGRIERSFLNGDNVETLLTELNIPTDIALDIRSRKMYWVERDTQKHNGKIIHKGKIQRANLDGSNITDILTGLNYVAGIALDTEGVYDVTPTTNKLTTTWANIKIR